MGTAKRILLHSCCAPCASASAERLLAGGYEVVLFFSNSNIWPRQEYDLRLKNLYILGRKLDVEVVEDEYDHEAWLRFIAGLEGEPERGARCPRCFEFSLRRTAEHAKANGYDAFCTSLTISPLKNSKVIAETGGQYPLYEHHDFKKKNGFQRSVDLSKKLGLYRQDYCACEFSMNNQNYLTREGKALKSK